MEKYKMSDDVISHIAKGLQMALITGTDIVDNLRLIDLCVEDGAINIHPEFEDSFNKNVEEMLENPPSKENEQNSQLITNSPFNT